MGLMTSGLTIQQAIVLIVAAWIGGVMFGEVARTARRFITGWVA